MKWVVHRVRFVRLSRRIEDDIKMKITEMNDCIEKMRDCYKFDDEKTEIRLGNLSDGINTRCVSVATRDDNGTLIEMSRYVDELK